MSVKCDNVYISPKIIRSELPLDMYISLMSLLRGSRNITVCICIV